MRNKAFLSLMELICMAGVFALAAAICIRGFLLANTISTERHALDCAVVSAQNAAELLKAHKGDTETVADILDGSVQDGNLVVFYNSDWAPVTTADEAEYILRSLPLAADEAAPSLAKAEIEVVCGNEHIFSLTVGWQEVYDDEE